MKFLYSAALLLPSLVVAGDVCLSTYTEISQDGRNAKKKWDVFAAEDLCLDNSQRVDPEQEDFCDGLPLRFKICGRTASLVTVQDAGVVDEAGGCGIRLELDGEIYPGRRVHHLSEDQGNPCSAECGEPSPSVLDGKVVFKDLPMCN